MIQQIIALVVIIFFLVRLFIQKKNEKINNKEFVLWLFFWLVGGIAILFIKKIDLLVARIGFSGNGIDVLLYIGIIILFYSQFKIMIRQEKIEKDITKIIREITLNNKK